MGSEMLVLFTSHYLVFHADDVLADEGRRGTKKQTAKEEKEEEKEEIEEIEVEAEQGSLITVDCNRFFLFLSQPALMSRKLFFSS